MEATSGPTDEGMSRVRPVLNVPTYSVLLPRYKWRRLVLLMSLEARKKEAIHIDTTQLHVDPRRPDLVPLRLPSGGWPEFIGSLPKY